MPIGLSLANSRKLQVIRTANHKYILPGIPNDAPRRILNDLIPAEWQQIYEDLYQQERAIIEKRRVFAEQHRKEFAAMLLKMPELYI